jgi:hypothetical protein
MATYFVDGAVGNDANAGTTAGAGNAWATINRAANTAAGTPIAVAGDLVHIKASATYTLTTAQVFTNSGNATNGAITYRGYTTTPGADDGRPRITCNSSGVNLFDVSGKTGLCFVHLKFDHQHATRGNAFIPAGTGNANMMVISDCVFENLKSALSGNFLVTYTFTNLLIERTEIKNCNEHGIWISAGSGLIRSCYIHDVTSDGIKSEHATVSQNVSVMGSVIRDCDRAIHFSQGALGLDRCAIYSNTSQGVYKDTATLAAFNIMNTIFHDNVNGVNVAAGKVVPCVNSNNAYGTHTGSKRIGWPTGVNDVDITGDPWTNVSTPDFSLDNTTNEGALCRNAGYPGVTLFGTGYSDIGPLRHADPSGGGGMIIHPGLVGGVRG